MVKWPGSPDMDSGFQCPSCQVLGAAMKGNLKGETGGLACFSTAIWARQPPWAPSDFKPAVLRLALIDLRLPEFHFRVPALSAYPDSIGTVVIFGVNTPPIAWKHRFEAYTLLVWVLHDCMSPRGPSGYEHRSKGTERYPPVTTPYP